MSDRIAKVSPYRTRVAQGALERLERHAVKSARVVLRGLGGSNASRILDEESGSQNTNSLHPSMGKLSCPISNN